MAYSHTSLAGLKAQLSSRLGDALKTFWVDIELGLVLSEAIRTFGLLSAFWRERGTLVTSSGTAFYDIATNLDNGQPTNNNILSYTVTDRDLVQQIQYHLLESASSQSSWTGTEMFTLDDIRYALQRRRDQFLADTGVVVNRSLVNVASPPIGRQQLVDTIIDVRRAAWLGVSPFDYYNVLWRDDERLFTAANSNWSVTSGTPECYSIMAPPPLELQLAPPPLSTGQVELLTVDAGASFAPASAATIIGIPDDLTPAVKWGALADLLGNDGIARDAIRAAYCEQMYQLYVQFARVLPIVIHAELNGVPLIPATLYEIESSTPNWQNISDTPQDIAIVSPNMIAINPVPDGVYSITLDVVRKSVVPDSDGDSIQVGREQLDMIMDYAEHLALFKVGGQEWHATERQAKNFMAQSATYNHRIGAAARAAVSAAWQSNRQKDGIPRRISTRDGLGAMKESSARS